MTKHSNCEKEIWVFFSANIQFDKNPFKTKLHFEHIATIRQQFESDTNKIKQINCFYFFEISRSVMFGVCRS